MGPGYAVLGSGRWVGPLGAAAGVVTLVGLVVALAGASPAATPSISQSLQAGPVEPVPHQTPPEFAGSESCRT